jgi:hypothetical protein
MAHTVKLALPWQELTKADAEFEISTDDGKLAKLKISKGGIEWKPKHSRKSGIKMSWTMFADIIENS